MDKFLTPCKGLYYGRIVPSWLVENKEYLHNLLDNGFHLHSINKKGFVVGFPIKSLLDLSRPTDKLEYFSPVNLFNLWNEIYGNYLKYSDISTKLNVNLIKLFDYWFALDNNTRPIIESCIDTVLNVAIKNTNIKPSQDKYYSDFYKTPFDIMNAKTMNICMQLKNKYLKCFLS